MGLVYVELHTDAGASHAKARAELEGAIRVFEELDDKAGLARAVGSVLGPEGTTVTTLQFVATRDPAMVATDPLTGLPRPDRLAPGGPLTAPPGRTR